MQLLRRRRALILVLTALLVTVCRCNPNIFGSNTESYRFTDGSVAMSCKFFTVVTEIYENKEKADEAAGSNRVWECSLACPDGSQAKFDLYTQPAYMIDATTEEDKAAYKAQYCSAEAMVAAETEPSPTNTPQPTSTPEPVAQEQVIIIPTQNLLIIQPILDGSVTACDTGQGFINFPLAEPLQDLTGKSVSVLLNGNKVNCVLAGTNSHLLGCSLPEGTVFPLIVSTTLDGVAVDNFSFNGAICTHTTATREPDTDEPQPTTQPPVDCDINPNPYEC